MQKYGQNFGKQLNEINREIHEQNANPLFKQKLQKHSYSSPNMGYDQNDYRKQPFDSFKYLRANSTHNKQFGLNKQKVSYMKNEN